MKKVFSMLVIMALCINLMAQGMNFSEDNWETILAKAKAENKIVFVDAYAVWCGPCKWMDANVFSDTKVGEFYNETFINAKIDMEKGEGRDIAKQYKVRAYPTFLFINGDGELVHRGVGGRPVDKFIALGEAANDPTMQLLGLEQQYNKGERGGEFMIRYAAALEDGGMDVAKVSDEYLSALDSYDDKGVMSFIYETTKQSTQKGFSIMADNLEAFSEEFGEDKVIQKVDYAIQRVHFSSLEKMAEMYEKYLPEIAKKLTAKHKMQYYMYARTKEAPKLFFEAAAAYYDEYEADDWTELNAASWHVYETSQDEAEFTKACDWAKKSVEMDANYSNMDTLAALYFKLGKKRKAKKWANKAIASAKENGENAASTKKLLKQIEAL